MLLFIIAPSLELLRLFPKEEVEGSGWLWRGLGAAVELPFLRRTGHVRGEDGIAEFKLYCGGSLFLRGSSS